MSGLKAVEHVDGGAVEEIALAYLTLARGDARAALEAIVRDGLDDFNRERRRLDEVIRRVSRGYSRGCLDG